MSKWSPKRIWDGHPCYIIGGGPSLEGFDFELLKTRKVIGCNAACYLPPGVVNIVIFGDTPFYYGHKQGLESYVKRTGGWVVTNATLNDAPPPWLKELPKVNRGASTEGLGWNRQTGSSAVNLALLLGASPIYLLGYDGQPSKDGRENFHSYYPRRSLCLSRYPRFREGMGWLAKQIGEIFPNQEVVNLEDDTSQLECFPKESLKAHFRSTE